MTRLLQSPRPWAILTVAVWLVGIFLVEVASVVVGFRDQAVLISAWWAAAFWTAGAAQWLWLPPGRWQNREGWFELARGTWILGLALLLVHVVVTFELVHGWSHVAAFEHTRRAAGFGEGVYVNYLVVLVWAIDAAWVSVGPTSYSRRPRLLGWAVHGFLAFIVFNSTLVFGTGFLKWAAGVWFGLLALCLVRRLVFERPVSE